MRRGPAPTITKDLSHRSVNYPHLQPPTGRPLSSAARGDAAAARVRSGVRCGAQFRCIPRGDPKARRRHIRSILPGGEVGRQKPGSERQQASSLAGPPPDSVEAAGDHVLPSITANLWLASCRAAVLVFPPPAAVVSMGWLSVSILAAMVGQGGRRAGSSTSEKSGLA